MNAVGISYRSNIVLMLQSEDPKLNTASRFQTLTPVPTYSRVPEKAFNSGEEMKSGTESNWQMTCCYGAAASALYKGFILWA